jgi:hypothetical protein
MLVLLVMAGGLGVAGLCACAPVLPPEVLTQIEATRVARATEVAKADAPRSYLLAEKRHREARAAFDGGDFAGAQILGERADVAYQQLVVTARRVRAEAQRDVLLGDERRISTELAEHEAQVQRVRADVRALEARLALVSQAGEQDAVVDHALGATLGQQARLLCTAAKLLRDAAAPASEALREAMAAVEALPTPVGRARAAVARQGCLDVLVATRRVQADVRRAPFATDRLLAALSRGGWSPRREDAGIRVELPLAAAASTHERVATLSALAAKHRGFSAILVVPAERASDATTTARGGDDHRAMVATLRANFEGAALVVAPTPSGARSTQRPARKLAVLLVSPE